MLLPEELPVLRCAVEEELEGLEELDEGDELVEVEGPGKLDEVEGLGKLDKVDELEGRDATDTVFVVRVVLVVRAGASDTCT